MKKSYQKKTTVTKSLKPKPKSVKKSKVNPDSFRDQNQDQSGSVIYGTEKESLKYLNSFISSHPRLSDKEIHSLACRHYYLQRQHNELLERVVAIETKMTEVKDATSLSLLEDEKEELLSLIQLYDYEAVCQEIMNTLIIYNLRLIIKIANAYSSYGIALDDLIQEGIFGFMHAIKKYDPSCHVKLATFSTWWIRQKIVRSLSNKARLIRLPVHLTTDITKVLAAIKKNKIPYSPDNLSKLAKLTNLTEEKVASSFNHVYSWRPYNQFDMSKNELVDPVEKIVDSHKQVNQLDDIDLQFDELKFITSFMEAIQTLTEFEQEYISRKYGLNGYPLIDRQVFKDWYSSVSGGSTKSYTVVKKTIYLKLLKFFFS